MQSDSELPPPSAPAAANATTGGGWQASTPGITGKSETIRGAGPKTPPKPGMSKVILRAMADKGSHHLMSLATLKNAVANTGYDMIRNAWRFKRTLKELVDQGILRQVTGKGALGSFCLGKKQASKPKLEAKRLGRPRRRPGQRRPGRRQPGKRRPGKHQPGKRRPRQHQARQRQALLGSKHGHKRLLKGVRRVTKRCRN